MVCFFSGFSIRILCAVLDPPFHCRFKIFEFPYICKGFTSCRYIMSLPCLCVMAQGRKKEGGSKNEIVCSVCQAVSG